MPTWYQESLELGKCYVASLNASMERLNCGFCNKRGKVLYIIQVPQVLVGIEVHTVHCLSC